MVLNTEWSQVEVIDLVNDGNGLGFILVGGRSTGVVIKALTPGGVAERDNRLQCGDHLLQIGEVNLRGFSSEQVATVLRQTGAQVRLIVARPVEPAANDFQALASHAPIIPTKLLSDPEELSRHLYQNQNYANTNTNTTGTVSVSDIGNAVLGCTTICFLPPSTPNTSDTELADLPLPPIPRDLSSSGTARICPKDLDIVPFSIVPPPSLQQALLKNQQQQQQQHSNMKPDQINNMDHIVTVISSGCTASGTSGPEAQTDERPSSATSSSEYIDSPETETYTVRLSKNVYGLGITVAGYVCEEEDLSGIFVKSIIEGSAAEMSGQIQINDRIVAVNGRTLAGVTNHQAVEILRNTDIEVHLTLERFLRGRKYEHLQVALTDLKAASGSGGDLHSLTSLPASPSIATLSWFPPKSDADSIATDGSIGGAFVIMDYGDLPSHETVDSNMSHVLDRSDHSGVSSAKRLRTPSTSEDGKQQQYMTNNDSLKRIHETQNDGLSQNMVLSPVKKLNDHSVQLNGTIIGSKTPTNDTNNILTTTKQQPPPASKASIKATVKSDKTKVAEGPPTTNNKSNNNNNNNIIPGISPSAIAKASIPNGDVLKVTWKSEFPESEIIVAEINKLSGLGISLEGTVDVECGIEKRPHHYIRSILEDGPVGKQGILKPGDELLQVNEFKLQGLRHTEVVKILKELPTHVKLICARGPKAPSVINTSQNPEAFETRSILPGGHQGLQNLMMTTKAQSESSLYTSSTATLTDQQQRSKSLENVSGLALWSTDVIAISIEKTEQGFGFSILDYQDPMDPDGSVIVIRGLIRGGAAEATNEIFPGDRLVSVGEKSLNGLDLDEAVSILKGMQLGLTKLGICRPLSNSDSNIASPTDDGCLDDSLVNT